HRPFPCLNDAKARGVSSPPCGGELGQRRLSSPRPPPSAWRFTDEQGDATRAPNARARASTASHFGSAETTARGAKLWRGCVWRELLSSRRHVGCLGNCLTKIVI